MTVRFAIVVDDNDARRVRRNELVGIALLERTLIDPPRGAACKTWAQQLRSTFPNATLVPYAWHLLTHAREDGLRDRGSRSLPGDDHAFGRLAPTEENAAAMGVMAQVVESLQTDTLAIRTPPGLTPGAIGRKRIAEFVRARGEQGIGVVWEPEGLWTPLEAMAAASGAQVLLPAFEGGRPQRVDDGPVLAAPGAWLRVDGAGPRRSIHGGHVDALVEHIEDLGGATLVFTGPRAAANLQLVAETLIAEDLV